MLKEVLEELGPRIDQALSRFLQAEAERAGGLSDFHGKYYGDLREFLLRGGKRLRPIALVVAYEGVGGEEVEAAIEASISVELLHNSSLIHDDIVDRDELRRGGKTVHAMYRDWFKAIKGGSGDAEHFGLTVGLLAGDSLFNMGFKALSQAKFNGEVKVKALKLYVEAYEQLIDGMLMDIYLPMMREPTVEDYLTMIKLKTGALFEKSLAIGSTLARATPSQIAMLSQYGILAAQGFQIRDDILGLYGREEVVGKPVGSDIREGKMTILVIKALQQASPKDRDKLRRVLGKRDLSTEDVEEARGIIKDAGALEYAERLASELINEAKRKIRMVDPPLTERAVSFFEELADFFIHRSY
ncbi:MAG: polyprenyl synthetase family protein [Candidatus Nezhaarchaeales archaeon]